ncbi:MAG TPA: metallophosphoesterase family protein, partial [Gemmatimonadales bacterium]|nr:metallophosphoesterase family protein [Gemmatimonadales bacterium]
MRLGIISDTHGLLRPEVFEVFREVDRILHAGDIGSVALLDELEAIAPVTAVYGNTDGFDLRNRLPAVVETRIEGLDFVVTHGDQFGSPTPELLSEAYPTAEVIVFGHTHKPL